MNIRPLLERYAATHPTTKILICSDGSPYMSQYRLADLGKDHGRVTLQHFHRGDEDRELHGHPWHGVSLILSGGYREERRAGNSVVSKVFLPGDVNVICPDTYHRIDLLREDCWTLFATGPVVAKWGFWSRDTGEFTPWRKFIERKGLVPVGSGA